MDKLSLTINIINFLFTLINAILSTILQSKKSSFNIETKTSLVRYRYFENVLIEPYFKLIITSLFYDIFYYLATYFLTKFFFKLSTEKNEENIRTKSVQENMISNIMVEFLFMTMIKGLALGFGIFYIYELVIEINRILNAKEINNRQEDILQQMIMIVYACGILNFSTILYQFIFYGIRLYIACKRKKNFFFLQENRLKNGVKNIHPVKHGMKKVTSFGNISLPETHGEDEINYEKLDN